MNGYIDFHAHILPGADHGSKDVETSLVQLELASCCGVECIVATPHFYPDTREARCFFSTRDKAYNDLMKAYHGKMQILIGAEVFLCEGLQNYPDLAKLCIEGTSILLVEMPNPPWPRRYEDTLFSLENAGYIIILAHIDRYPLRYTSRLLELGFKWQINAGSISSRLRKRKFSHYLDNGSICAIGSDIHGNSDAYRYYAKAMDHLGKQGILLQDRMREILR